MQGRDIMKKNNKRFKSAREQDAEYRMYERNPTRCYTCDEPLTPDNPDRKRRRINYYKGLTLCDRCKDFQEDGVEKLGKALGL